MGYVSKIYRLPLRFKSPVDLSGLPSEAQISAVCFFDADGRPVVVRYGSSSSSKNFVIIRNFYRGSPLAGADDSMPQLSFSDGTVSTFSWDPVNARPTWKGSWTVWYSLSKGGWLFSKSSVPPEPTEVTNPLTETVTGDEYYTGGLPSLTSESELKPGPVVKYKKDKEKAERERRKQERQDAGLPAEEDEEEEEKITVKFKWSPYLPKDVDSTGCGKYELKKFGEDEEDDGQTQEPSGDDEGEGENVIVIGNPQWRDKKGAKYVRSVDKVNGNYTYGSVHNDRGTWVIGAKGSSSGWWEGPEPQPEEDVEFTFVKPADAPEDMEDQPPVSLKWDAYVIGPETADDTYLGEVARWL